MAPISQLRMYSRSRNVVYGAAWGPYLADIFVVGAADANLTSYSKPSFREGRASGGSGRFPKGECSKRALSLPALSLQQKVVNLWPSMLCIAPQIPVRQAASRVCGKKCVDIKQVLIGHTIRPNGTDEENRAGALAPGKYRLRV